PRNQPDSTCEPSGGSCSRAAGIANPRRGDSPPREKVDGERHRPGEEEPENERRDGNCEPRFLPIAAVAHLRPVSRIDLFEVDAWPGQDPKPDADSDRANELRDGVPGERRVELAVRWIAEEQARQA